MTAPDDQDPTGKMPIAESPAPQTEPVTWSEIAPAAGPSTEPATPTSRAGSSGRLRAGLVVGAVAAAAIGVTATALVLAPDDTSTTASTTWSRDAGDRGVGGGSRGHRGAGDIAPASSVDRNADRQADTFDHGRMGGHGFQDITISAISGSQVTVKADDGWTRTITVTDDVELTKGGQAIELSELKVGDEVRISQTRNDDGTYTVDAIAVVVPSAHGTVSDVTSSGFKVTTRDGSVWTITVDSSTEYQYGTGTGSLADVTNGTTVVVLGTSTGDNALTALTVRVAPDRAAGTVTSKTPDTIVITQRDGTTLTVHVDGETTYNVAGVDSADLGDVAVDMAIGVTGRARSDGSIDADTVVAGTGHGMFHMDGDGSFGPGGRGGHGGRGGFGGFGPDMDEHTDATPSASPTTSS